MGKKNFQVEGSALSSLTLGASLKPLNKKNKLRNMKRYEDFF